MAQWQGHVLVTSKTWVQVPGLAYFVIIFQTNFLCSVSSDVHRVSTRSKRTGVQEMQIKGSDPRPMVNVGQCTSTRSRKVSRWQTQLGQAFQIHTS